MEHLRRLRAEILRREEGEGQKSMTHRRAFNAELAAHRRLRSGGDKDKPRTGQKRAREDENEDDNAMCGICQDDEKPPTNPIKTECNHVFCADCLLGWWTSTKPACTCPMCREDLRNSPECMALNKRGSLFVAAENGHASLVELLLANGADPNARDASDLASVGRMHHGTHASKPSLAHGRFKQGKERSQAPQGVDRDVVGAEDRGCCGRRVSKARHDNKMSSGVG